MHFRSLSQLFSRQDLWNAVLGFGVVVGGLALSALTLYVHRTGDPQVATLLAVVSLISVLLIIIFVVPPLVRNAGREVSQLNLPFEFTVGGAVFFVLVLVVGFSAWNTGNNLLFLILSFLLAALVVGFFAGSLCLKKLDIRMRFPETIFAGEPIPLLVGITNRKRFVPAFSVIVVVRGKERDRSVAAAELENILPAWLARRVGRSPVVSRTLDHFEYVPARGQVEVKTEHVFSHRGRLLIKDFELSTKFPFGFFRHRRRLAAREAEIIVFPKIVEVGRDLSDAAAEAGSRTLVKRGAGTDLLALRGYRPHDDFRSIDWKATARTRDLIVREFAAEEERNVCVVLETLVPAEAAGSVSLRDKIALEQSGRTLVLSPRFEEGASLAASVLLQLAAEGANFRLILGEEYGDLAMGRQHLYDSLKRLALVEPVFSSPDSHSEPGEHLLRIFEVAGDTQIVLITALREGRPSPETRDQLNIITF